MKRQIVHCLAYDGNFAFVRERERVEIVERLELRGMTDWSAYRLIRGHHQSMIEA